MIVVTGGAGFIGSAMIWQLNQQGRTDLLVVDELGSSSKWQNWVGLRFDDYLHKDEFLRRLLSGELPNIEAIIHMGANSSTTETDVEALMATNYAYTRELATYCLARDIRFIYASSAATYGDGLAGYVDTEAHTPSLRPLNAYGYSKHLFDLWAMSHGAADRIVGLKFFNVFGPNEYHKGDMASVVYKAVGQIEQEGKVRLFESHRYGIGHGEQRRDFVYVKDCVRVMSWLVEHPEVNGLFNLGTGVARSFKDLVLATFAALGREPAIEYIPMPTNLRDRYQYFTEADMSKLRATGCPTDFGSLEDSVKDYVQGYLTQPIPYLTTNR